MTKPEEYIEDHGSHFDYKTHRILQKRQSRIDEVDKAFSEYEKEKLNQNTVLVQILSGFLATNGNLHRMTSISFFTVIWIIHYFYIIRYMGSGRLIGPKSKSGNPQWTRRPRVRPIGNQTFKGFC